jgi:hypothetical protein
MTRTIKKRWIWLGIAGIAVIARLICHSERSEESASFSRRQKADPSLRSG